MKIDTTRFGEIEIETEEMIEFAQGIPGFETEKKFVIIPCDEKGSFVFLQSMEKSSLAFLLTNPFSFFAQYTFGLDDDDIEQLAIEDENDIMVYTIITVHNNDIKEMTANLLAPIIINQKNNMAKQVILDSGKFTTRYNLFAESAEYPEGGK